jgi:hypothetical protein
MWKEGGKGKDVAVLNYLSTMSWDAYGSGGIAPPFWPWNSKELSGCLHTLVAWPPGKQPPVPIG